MDYKTVMISAARYLELRHDIVLDVSDIKSIMLLSNFAKTLNDESVTFYWKEFKKSYRELKEKPQLSEAKCGEVDKQSYYLNSKIDESVSKESLANMDSTKESPMNGIEESKNWLNLQDEGEAKAAILLPTVAI